MIFLKRKTLVLLASQVFLLAATNSASADSTVNQAFTPQSSQDKKLADEKATRYQERMERDMRGIVPFAEPNIPYSKVLSTAAYSSQPDYYTCGPTAAHNLLLNWSQWASIDQLKKDLGYVYQEGTGFGPLWPQTLNKYTNSSYYVLQWTPSESTLWGAFVYNKADSRPFIMDVHMSSSTGALVGYPVNTDYWHERRTHHVLA